MHHLYAIDLAYVWVFKLPQQQIDAFLIWMYWKDFFFVLNDLNWNFLFYIKVKDTLNCTLCKMVMTNVKNMLANEKSQVRD